MGYIDQLKANTAEVNRQREEEARAKRPPIDTRVSEHWRPLTVQIEELMRRLPPVRRDRSWSMEELVARLHGHYKPRPSKGDVGEALRALGWTQRRDWAAAGAAGRREWVLPNADLSSDA